MAGQNIIQHPLAEIFIMVHHVACGELKDSGNLKGILVSGQPKQKFLLLIQRPLQPGLHRLPLFLRHFPGIVHQIFRRVHQNPYIVTGKVPQIGRLAHLKQSIHQLFDGQQSGMISGSPMNIPGSPPQPPVLGLGRRFLMTVDIFCGFQHSLSDHGTGRLLGAQIRQKLGSVIMHGIRKGIPRNLRIHLPVIGGIDHIHGSIEAFHVLLPLYLLQTPPASVLLQIPHHMLQVAQTAYDIAPGLSVAYFPIALQIGRPGRKVFLHQIVKQPLLSVSGRDVQIQHGDPLMIKLPNHPVYILMKFSIFIEQLVDSVCDTRVRAAVIAEQLIRQRRQLLCLLWRKRLSRLGEQYLLQNAVIFLMDPKKLLCTAAYRFNDLFLGHAGSHLRLDQTAGSVQILNIPFIKIIHPYFLPVS